MLALKSRAGPRPAGLPPWRNSRAGRGPGWRSLRMAAGGARSVVGDAAERVAAPLPGGLALHPAAAGVVDRAAEGAHGLLVVGDLEDAQDPAVAAARAAVAVVDVDVLSA